jgi:hypothetical protein
MVKMDKEVRSQNSHLSLLRPGAHVELDACHVLQGSGAHAYEFLNDVDSLQKFMTSYAFVVWDYMCLLKTLQNKVACVSVPWVPVENGPLAMAINRLVCREEADLVADGLITSRFELFLKAMVEVGADTKPILSFLTGIKRGRHPLDALATLPLPQGTKSFVASSLGFYKGASHQAAAAFLYGHTDAAPMAMRRALLDIEAELGKSCYWLRLYLSRVLDHEDGVHGPVIRDILAQVCGNDGEKWQGASEAAKKAFSLRQELLADLFVSN